MESDSKWKSGRFEALVVARPAVPAVEDRRLPAELIDQYHAGHPQQESSAELAVGLSHFSAGLPAVERKKMPGLTVWMRRAW